MKGTLLTFTATVASGGKPVTQGSATFCNKGYLRCEDMAILGTVQLTPSGAAAIKLALPVGTNSIQVKCRRGRRRSQVAAPARKR